MNAVSQSPLAPGLTIAGRFTLLRPLGHGGMGSVWVAKHATLGTEVALKFVEIAGDGSSDPNMDAVRRFEREANIIARLRSPHVVQILDYAIDEAGRPYLAMELLHGESLKERLDRVKTLSIEETVPIVVQACRALHRAHKAGVVHRDIKPPNIFLCEEDEGVLVKVLDFGIAKVAPMGLEPGDTQKTETGVLVGTPAFMSPEQVLGAGELDGRSDLYSLAIVAWRAIAGTNPHERDGKPLGIGELVIQIATRTVAPLSSHAKGISPELDAWFAKALALQPSQRFSSAKAMATALATATNMLNLMHTGANKKSLPEVSGLVARKGSPLEDHTSSERTFPEMAAKLRASAVAAAAVTQPAESSGQWTGDSRPSERKLSDTQSSSPAPAPENSAPPARRRGVLVGVAAVMLMVLGGVVALRRSPAGAPPTTAAPVAALAPPQVPSVAPPEGPVSPPVVASANGAPAPTNRPPDSQERNGVAPSSLVANGAPAAPLRTRPVVPRGANAPPAPATPPPAKKPNTTNTLLDDRL